jgi:alpha-L-fucosidase 2
MKEKIIAALIFLSAGMASFASDLVLWYQHPIACSNFMGETLPMGKNSSSHFMDEALPIGNGRSGALISGGVAREDLVLNEDSLWSGDENPSGDYGTMGTYQMFGHLIINLDGHGNFSNYRRDLDIGDALAHVSYEINGTHFSREFFCSHADGIMVVHLTADKPGSYSGSIELNDSRVGKTVAENGHLTFAGHLMNGMRYEAQLLALNSGGTLKTNGSVLEFKNCDSLTLLVALGTDYVMDYSQSYHGEDPHPRLIGLIKDAGKRSYVSLRVAHEKDFGQLFKRVKLDLGQSTPEQIGMPTDQRKIKAAEAFDPELEELLFQYGRYLLVSCSRPGGLPANLQGLWCDSNNPPWDADYHTDLNIEMNYWPAETANLSECHLPFFDLVLSQVPVWRSATEVSPEFKTSTGQMTTRGWAIRVSHNIHGGLGWEWDKTANAWYCHHFWEHYDFTQDKEFLKNTAYPVMKEICEFWQDHLKTLPDGRMVVPHAWSPEHGPTEDGVSYSQEIVWDLFDNYVQAADALGVDKDFRNRIAGMRDKLATPGIGNWGQLLEWMTEQHDTNNPELDTPNDHHRHTSHLFAVYPGDQISPRKTPALAAAAKTSLDARGDTGDVREWSFAWRTALYARLHDGQDAHRELQQLFSTRNTCLNLFGMLPPMQIDGNFGITAAMCEMLMQTQNGSIDLLPALPKEWPNGLVNGLRARGGFTVNIQWANGKLIFATIYSSTGNDCRLQYGNAIRDIKIPDGKSITVDGKLVTVKSN